MPKISFELPPQEAALIDVIAMRVKLWSDDNGENFDVSDTVMDLRIVHKNIIALRLDEMARVIEEGDLMHDVAGIRRHLNRRTGQLEDCFLPRFAVAETVAED